jgi:hypothetical protein
MFTVVINKVVEYCLLPFDRANAIAKDMRRKGYIVVVRRTTDADLEAEERELRNRAMWDKHEAQVKRILDDVAKHGHSTMTTNGWVRNNVAYGATML